MILALTASLICMCMIAIMVALLFDRPRPTLSSGELIRQLQLLDVDAFLNLVDPGDHAFLRERLSPWVFWRVHIERMFAAIQYCGHAAMNAGILMKIAETSKSDTDTRVAAISQSLYAEALNLRVCALQMMARLALSAFVPGTSVLPETFASNYESASCRYRNLTHLQVTAAFVSAA
jgi:hypothetical protein